MTSREEDDDLRFDLGGATPERLRRQASRLFGMTAAQARQVAFAAFAEAGSDKNRFSVLAALAEFGPSSQSALADRTGVYRSDLVGTINALAEAGHVQRAPDPADKRRNVISLTQAGEAHLAELDRILDGVNEHILAPLSKPERDQLFALLGRVNAHLAASRHES